MAAPDSKTLQSLSGNWKLNKDLSDDFTQVLELQGVNILIRKAVSTASVHLKITQPSEDKLQMEQTATAAAIPGTTEEYILDWTWRKSHDAFFGEIEGRSRWVEVDDVINDGSLPFAGITGDAAVKNAEWSEDCKGQGKKFIQAVGKKRDGSWTAFHLWGFERVGGERRHTRRVVVEADDGRKIGVRMVYDFEVQ